MCHFDPFDSARDRLRENSANLSMKNQLQDFQLRHEMACSLIWDNAIFTINCRY